MMILQHVGKGEFENDTVPIAGQAPKRHPTFAPAKFSRRFESTLPQHRLPSGWSWELAPGLWCQFYILNSEREFMIHDEIQLSNNIKKIFFSLSFCALALGCGVDEHHVLQRHDFANLWKKEDRIFAASLLGADLD